MALDIPTITSPSVEMELGGAKRQIRLDLNAYARVDEQMGINLLNDPTSIQNPSAAMLRVLVWAGLVTEDPELRSAETGIEKVGSWIDFGNYADALNVVTKAFTLSIPEPGSTSTNGATPKNQRRGSAG